MKVTFAEDFEKVERKALVENTAQDIFNILKDLESQATLHASRWIWELLQNARDASTADSPLHVSINLASSEVTFRHSGESFTPDQVAHLIHHGSTKNHEEGQVGRFGTGFLSSHIISKVPRVSGRLEDGRPFSFILDRTGTTPAELTASMDRSSKEFVNSVSDGITSASGHSTEFVYPLTSGVEAIAQKGVESLETYAPYVLTFNEEIDSIEISTDGQCRVYKRKPSETLGRVTVTTIEVNGASEDAPSVYSVASIIDGGLSVAVVGRQSGSEQDAIHIEFGPEVPRFFMAFPLFGTESIGLPGVVNSRQFFPKRDRDGLYLGQEDTEFNNENKNLVQQACPLFLLLLEECATRRWKGVDLLCRIATVGSTRGVDESWLNALIKDSIVEKVRHTPLLVTCGQELIAPRDAQIPHGSPEVEREELWELLYELSESDKRLVERATSQSWEQNVTGWSDVLDIPVADMPESMTSEKCAKRLASFGSLDGLRAALRPESDAAAWCNTLFDILIREDQTRFLQFDFESTVIVRGWVGVISVWHHAPCGC